MGMALRVLVLLGLCVGALSATAVQEVTDLTDLTDQEYHQLGEGVKSVSALHQEPDEEWSTGPTCVFERQLGKTIPQVLPDSDTFPDLEDGKHACLQV